MQRQQYRMRGNILSLTLDRTILTLARSMTAHTFPVSTQSFENSIAMTIIRCCRCRLLGMKERKEISKDAIRIICSIIMSRTLTSIATLEPLCLSKRI